MGVVLPLSSNLFAGEPDRRSVQWQSEPYDDEGEGLILFDGSDRDPQLPVNLEVPRRGKLTDFLYSPLLLLFVSNRARGLLQQYRIDGVTAHPLILRDRTGTILDDSYWWLNCRVLADVMNEDESGVEYRPDGSIKRVQGFVVDRNRVPALDLFMCRRPTLRVLRQPLVQAIQQSGLTGYAFEPLDGLRWPA